MSMLDRDEIEPEAAADLEKALAEAGKGFTMPPPVFAAMQGRLVAFDPDTGELVARFPILPEQLNPYGTMQGGMIAAAIDNTVGPLSMLVAPPNITRRLEIKYRRAASLETGRILVRARLTERRKGQLVFAATVEDDEGTELARARAVHWIVDTGDSDD